jgi:hypothetical protein
MAPKKIFVSSVILCVWLMFFLAANAAVPEKILKTGETWEVAGTTELSRLVVSEGAGITAPEGHTVTLTVDGVETPLRPGAYKGTVVLTVAEEIFITASVFGDESTYRMRAGIDVKDGTYRAKRSVPAAVTGGTITDEAATGVRIASVGENFNGIIVEGDSTYTIQSPEIDFTGYGGNDFAGYGAAIMTEGTAKVTVNDASIRTRGAIRSAAVVRGSSTLYVNDSEIEVQNGALPEGYEFHWSNPNGVSLMIVPWMLGLTGNCRATNLIENGTAYYTNTHIKAQGWGCLSTDGVQNVNLYARDSHIETVDSGYGSYADGSTNNFSGCTFDVKDYALIMTGGTGVFTDHCTVNSKRIGVMFHGGGNLTIDKGSVFNTKKAVIQVKGAQPDITVDGATLTSENGLILQAMENDDPNKAGSGAAGAPTPTASNASMGDPAGMLEGGGMPGGEMPPGDGMPAGPGGASGAAKVTFRNMTLDGDIVTSMTSQADLVVALEKTTLAGAVSTATAEHVVGPNGEELVMQDETDLYYLIGEIIETYCATDDPFGVEVSLDGVSTWIVEKTSYITSLTLADGAVLKAPRGHRLSMSVDGKKVSIRPGGYEGKIVLTVKEG